jgi:phosphodiesterase/alkaline phosphatase D-like protein
VVAEAADTEEDSTFCELLGRRQRAWLESVLNASTAPVKVLASGSVVFGSSGLNENGPQNNWQGRCSS